MTLTDLSVIMAKAVNLSESQFPHLGLMSENSDKSGLRRGNIYK